MSSTLDLKKKSVFIFGFAGSLLLLLSLVVVCRLLTAVASLMEHRLSSKVCGVFPDQGSNPCPPDWQADS